MGFFTKAVEEFAGFGGKEAIAKSLSQADDAIKFVHLSENPEFQAVAIMRGEKKLGQLKFTISGEAASVKGVYVDPSLRDQGFGRKLYEQAFEKAKSQGAKFITSDIQGSTSMDAARVWEGFMKHGYDVERIQVKAGTPGYKLSLENQLPTGKSAISTQVLQKAANQTAQDMLVAGAGSDNSTMLNRGINSVRGSRRTTSAL